MKIFILSGLVLVGMQSCNEKSSSNSSNTTPKEKSQPRIQYSSPKEPLCPAHPEIMVEQGYGYMTGANEHKSCTPEHCLHDLREEKQIRQQTQERERLENELGY